jgi:hypothetical protein
MCWPNNAHWSDAMVLLRWQLAGVPTVQIQKMRG